jgi:hypothetical protein
VRIVRTRARRRDIPVATRDAEKGASSFVTGGEDRRLPPVARPARMAVRMGS